MLALSACGGCFVVVFRSYASMSTCKLCDFLCIFVIFVCNFYLCLKYCKFSGLQTNLTTFGNDVNTLLYLFIYCFGKGLGNTVCWKFLKCYMFNKNNKINNSSNTLYAVFSTRVVETIKQMTIIFWKTDYITVPQNLSISIKCQGHRIYYSGNEVF